MYMPYLMCGYGATVVLVLVAIRLASRTVPALRGSRLLTWALAFGLTALVLLAMRPFIPDWASILLANEAMFTYALLLYCAIAETLAIPPRFLPWGVAMLPVALAANVYFTYIHVNLVARILVGGGIGALYAAAAAALLFGYKEPDANRPLSEASLRTQTSALAWLQTLTLTEHLARNVLTLLYPPVDFIHLDTIQTVFSYTNMVLNVAITCGILWLALSVHRRELQRIAYTDSLTGQLNRRAFDDILANELIRCRHAGESLALLLVDIDHFKIVNDTWGHQAGDEVLQRVSAALRRNMRPVDVLSRFGGEEFVILLRQVDAAQAGEIAWRLRAEIACLADLPGDLRITASIGAAASHLGETPHQIMRRCDEALYRSKRGGRDLVTVDGPVTSQTSHTGFAATTL